MTTIKAEPKWPTTKPTEPTEQRGAGSGEYAVATRERQSNESPTEFIAKGRTDYEKLSEGQTAVRDRRAYLIDQAEKNEALNDELNAIQVEQNQKAQELFKKAANPEDPDEQRQAAIDALKAQDPDERNRAAQERGDHVEEQVFDTSTPDFQAGQTMG